jgi:hypothetical protein
MLFFIIEVTFYTYSVFKLILDFFLSGIYERIVVAHV